MTKKRLSDLLKEEVSKTDPSQPPASPPDPSPEPVPVSRRSVSRRRGSAAALQSATEETPPVEAAPSPKAATTAAVVQPSAEPPVVKAPDPRILELETALAASEAAKATLEKTVKGLQSDLEVQQARLFELKDSLDKTQVELREAKQTILNLSQGNAPAAAPTAPSRAIRSGVDIVPRQPATPPRQPGYVRGVPTQVPLGGQSNAMLSDADIGWVD
jgi:uncharacterized coiled-coil protein SlyX